MKPESETLSRIEEQKLAQEIRLALDNLNLLLSKAQQNNIEVDVSDFRCRSIQDPIEQVQIQIVLKRNI